MAALAPSSTTAGGQTIYDLTQTGGRGPTISLRVGGIALGDAARACLERTGLAALLVGRDGDVVGIAGWPHA